MFLINHMKFIRPFTFLLSLLAIISFQKLSYSQTVFSSFNLDTELFNGLVGSNPKNATSLSQDGYHYSYFSAYGNKHFTLVSPSGELINQVSKPNKLSRTDPLGTVFYHDSFYTFFFKNKSKNLLIIYSMHKDGTFRTEEKKIEVEKRENFIGVANDRNQLFFLYSSKKENKITTHHFRGVNDILRADYVLNQGSSPYPILKEYGDFHPIFSSYKTDLLTSKPKKKVYIENEIIYLVIENNSEDYRQASSHIFKLDPASNKYTYTALRSELNARDNQSNSLLFDNRVFKITLISDALELTIFNLNEWRTEKSFSYSKQDEKLNLMKGDLYREGTLNEMDGYYKTYEKVPAILRQLTLGTPTISVSILKQNEYALRIGAVGSSQESYSDLNGAAEQEDIFQTLNIYSASGQERRYFNSYLNRLDLSITETFTDHLSIYQTIKAFFDSYDRRGTKFTIRSIYSDENDDYYVSFFDTQKSTFSILKFE